MRALRFSVAHDSTAGFDQLPGVASVSVRGHHVELRSTDTDAALRALLAARPDAHDIEVAGVGLEDAFLALTDRSHPA